MKKLLLLIIVVLACLSGAFAQNNFSVSVSGHVYSDSGNIPLPNQPLNVQIMSAGMVQLFELFTDNTGFYEGTYFNYSQGTIEVSTLDCNGQVHSASAPFGPNNNVFVFDFVICSYPTYGCKAFYYYEVIPSFYTPVVAFYDQSTGNPSNWLWDFGDGTTSGEQYPVHTYDSYGVYFVCLTITNPDGSCQDMFCQEVNTNSTIPGCTNWFWYNQPSTYDFEFFADASPPAQYYVWDFGDGTTGTGQNITHSFSPNMGDLFLVTLTSYSFDPSTNDSCYAVSSQKVTTLGYPGDCYNWFWYNQTPNGSNIEFFAEAFPPALDYSWDFGDGTTGNGQSVSHEFDPNLGDIFLVTLTTTSVDPSTGDTCSSFSMQEVWLWNYPGDCSNWFSYSASNTGNVEFFGDAYPPAESYLWDFGDGTTGEGQFVSHIYDQTLGDVFLVTLTTTSYTSAGEICTAVTLQEVYLGTIPGGCYNSFWYKEMGDNTIYLFGESWPVPANQYIWTFPDGTVQYGQEVYYSYDPAIGTEFLVCLDTYIYANTIDSCYAQSCQMVFTGGWNWGSISGTIYTNDIPADQAFAMLYMITPDGIQLYDIQQCMPNSGFYNFQFMPAGDYYVVGFLSPASAYFNQFFPTYYENALYWYDATVINVIDPAAFHDIQLIPVSGSGNGVASISGNITVGEEGDPGANMQVLLMDTEGNPMAYTTSNDQGEYGFENLGFGNYKVKVEMPGTECEIANVELTSGNPHAVVNFFVNGTEIILGIGDYGSADLNVSAVYPNPAFDFVNFDIQSLTGESISVTIFDLHGKELSTFLYQAEKGKNTVSINVNRLPKGFYTITIQGNTGYQSSMKFLK